jgi:hypothetical protein
MVAEPETWPCGDCGTLVPRTEDWCPQCHPTKAKQVGGDHYSSMEFQPIDYILGNQLGFAEGAVIKYVSRWRKKGGVQDLDKAAEFIRFLREDAEAHPERYGL